MMKPLLSLLLACSAIHFSYAQQPGTKGPAVRFLVGGALEFGGDEVAKVYFTNGNEQSVNAGQGGSIAVGAQFQIPTAEKFLLRTTVGYKYLTTEADNVHIRLTRVPIIATANYMVLNKLRVGAGIATHQAIKFNAGGIGDNMTFSGAAGPTFEVAYAGIGLSYTAMKYKDNMNNSYSANAFGFTFSATFPNKKRSTTVIQPVND